MEEQKKYFIISTILFIIIAIVILQVDKYYDNKVKNSYTLETNKINNKYINVNDFGIYLQDKENSNNYVKQNNNEYPTEGYILNTSMTKCFDYYGKEVTGKVSQTDEGRVRLETTVSIYCQMYFDIDNTKPTVKSLTINGTDKDGNTKSDYIYNYGISYTVTWTDTDVVYYCVKEGSSTCSESDWQKTNGVTTKSGTITVSSEGAKTIYAYIRDKARNVSQVASKTITVDRTAPKVTLSLTGTADTGQTLSNSGTYTQTTSIKYTASITEDNMEGYCIGEGNCTTYTSSTTKTFNNVGISVSDTEGLKTVKINVKDKAGNIGSASKTITLDKTNPSTPSIIEIYDIWGSRSYTTKNYSSNVGENGTWTTSNNDPMIIFNDIGNISGINGFYIELEEALNQDMLIQVFYATSTGSYNETNSVKGTLKAGDKKIYLPMSASGSWKQVRFDIGSSSGLKYTIKHLGLSGTVGQWNMDDVILRLTTTSKVGIDKWQYTGNTSSWSTYSSSNALTYITPEYSTERNSTEYVRACNESGRCSGNTGTIIKIDKTNPTASVSSVSAGTTSITVTVGGSDSGSGIAARYCKATKSGYDSGWKTASGTTCTISGLTEGTTYTIKVKTKDNSGRESSEVQYSNTVTTQVSYTCKGIGGTLMNHSTHGWICVENAFEKTVVNCSVGDSCLETGEFTGPTFHSLDSCTSQINAWSSYIDCSTSCVYVGSGMYRIEYRRFIDACYSYEWICSSSWGVLDGSGSSQRCYKAALKAS